MVMLAFTDVVTEHSVEEFKFFWKQHSMEMNEHNKDGLFPLWLFKTQVINMTATTTPGNQMCQTMVVSH